MNMFRIFLLTCTSSLLLGCSSIGSNMMMVSGDTIQVRPLPPEAFVVLVLKGRVIERLEIQAGSRATRSVFVPGLPGIGGAGTVLQAPSGPRPDPSHFIYEIEHRSLEGPPTRVAFAGNVAVGTCVELVAAEQSARRIYAYNLGQAVLRPATGCE
jgi:hypothetical protein